MSNISIQLELNDKPNKDGQTTIRVRISDSDSDKRHIRKVTDVKILSKFWTGKYGAWISNKHPESKALNDKLTGILLKYQRAYTKLSDDTLLIPTKEDVLNAVKKKEFHQDFLKYFDEMIQKMENYNQKKGYVTTYNKLLEYTKGKTLTFNQINKVWLEEFEEDLFNDEISPSSVHTQMKRIRAMFNYAISDKIISQDVYPFGNHGYTLPTPTETKVLERLDAEELAELFKQNYDKTQLKFYVHKAFCLSFLTAGTRIEDIMTLKWSNIKNGQIAYNMKKGVTGGTRKAFGIDSRLQKILDTIKKPSTKDDDYLFPFLQKGIENKDSETYKKEIGNKTALYNKYLKMIADDITTDKNLTSHIARHTWAALVYEQEKDIKLIQENLGHKDIKTTMAYIGRLSTKKNDEKLSNIYDNLF
jgi:integrase/recombinase XerD